MSTRSNSPMECFATILKGRDAAKVRLVIE